MGGWGDFSGHFSILLEPITKAFSKFAKNLLVIDFRLSFFAFLFSKGEKAAAEYYDKFEVFYY